MHLTKAHYKRQDTVDTAFAPKKKQPLIYMTILTLIILILPLNIASILSMNTVISGTHDSLAAAITSNLESYMAFLDKRVNSTDYFLYTVIENQDCKKFFQQPEDWTYTFHRYQVYQQFQSSLAIVDAADSMYFYIPARNDFLFVDKNKRDHLTAESSRHIVDAQQYRDGKWHLGSYDDHTYLIRNIKQGDISYGALINCDEDLPSFDYEAYTLELSSTSRGKSHRHIICTAGSSEIPCWLTFSISKNELSGSVETWKYLLFVLLAICLFIIPILFLAFRRQVSTPLNELNHGHEELRLGNESYRIQAQAGSAEFEAAYQGFNLMAQDLQLLRLEKINRELAYKQMQLNNLQLQIRPHFLLNMMNFLYTLIQNRQRQTAHELVLYLSQYFRYMFRNGKELELFEKELSLIKMFLQISEAHYPDSFTVSYQQLAARLLEVPGASAVNVALQAGYSNYPYFSTTFKKIYRCTPSQYAQQFTGKEDTSGQP